MSKAITFSRYGDPHVLTLTHVEDPEPGPDKSGSRSGRSRSI